jgi:hypothetical protein
MRKAYCEQSRDHQSLVLETNDGEPPTPRPLVRRTSAAIFTNFTRRCRHALLVLLSHSGEVPVQSEAFVSPWQTFRRSVRTWMLPAKAIFKFVVRFDRPTRQPRLMARVPAENRPTVGC